MKKMVFNNLVELHMTDASGLKSSWHCISRSSQGTEWLNVKLNLNAFCFAASLR